MAGKDGGTKWPAKMAAQNGRQRWRHKMAGKDGGTKWPSKMAAQNGPSKMPAHNGRTKCRHKIVTQDGGYFSCCPHTNPAHVPDLDPTPVVIIPVISLTRLRNLAHTLSEVVRCPWASSLNRFRT